MKSNIVLVCVGIGLLMIAFYRMGVLHFDRKFVVDVLPLAIAAIGLSLVARHIGGTALLAKGIEQAGSMITRFAPMLVVMFITMGYATVLINLYKDDMAVYLNGSKGPFGSLLASYVMPGSLTSMPIVKQLWDAGINQTPLIVFLLTSPLVGWQIMLIRQPMLGWRITLIQFCLGTCISFIIATSAWGITIMKSRL